MTLDEASLAFDPVSERLYVFNRLSRDITVIDTAARSVVATLDIGHDPAPSRVRAPHATRPYTGKDRSVLTPTGFSVPFSASVST